jgi:hypothetical protein
MRIHQALAALLLCAPVLAQADNCPYSRNFDHTVDAGALQDVQLISRAGDEAIKGVDGANEVRIKGRICASKESALDALEYDITTQGSSLVMERPEASWSFFEQMRVAYVDVQIAMPSAMGLSVQDRSGDVEIDNIHGGITVQDRSGDVTLYNTGGLVTLRDRSGDLKVVEHQGDVVVESDRSGDINMRGIQGEVTVMSDRSGDIELQDIASHVHIEDDSSGDIEVDQIGGDFIVSNDGSGGISFDDVSGNVQIPRNKR